MKALFIAYNQAYSGEIVQLLEDHGQRGFTRFQGIQGRGSETGEPHYGSHAWPTLNLAMVTIVPDEKAPEILKALKEKDAESPEMGLRAFQWSVETSI